MSIAYIVELTIEEGQKKAFEEKARTYASSVENSEPETTTYQWYLAEDGSRCILHECFTDSAALLRHLANVGPSLPDLLAIAPITRFEVLGTASPEVKEALQDFGTVYFPHLTGFERPPVAAHVS